MDVPTGPFPPTTKPAIKTSFPPRTKPRVLMLSRRCWAGSIATNAGVLKLLWKMTFFTALGEYWIVAPFALSATIKFPVASNAMPYGRPIPVTKEVLVPSGANLKIVPLPESASKRFPALSNASPAGKFNPVTNVVFVPSGANL